MEIRISAEPYEVAALFAKLGISVDVSNGEVIPVEKENVGKQSRMRTANEAYEMLKKEDPNTAVTLNHIKTIIRNGSLPVTKAGKKYLVDYDILVNYLSNPDKYKKPTASDGKIRKIN